MGLGKQGILLLFLHLFISIKFVSAGISLCDYAVQNLARDCVRPTDQVIYSTMDTGTSVFIAIVQELGRKRRGNEETAAATPELLMVSSSSNYELISVEGQQEVIVKNCLQTGKTEYLGLSLNQSFPNTDCGVWVIETYVVPMKPNFTMPSTVNLAVSSCLPEVDVLELQFENGRNCSPWNCSVNCTSDLKLFWVEGRTLRTSTNNTSFNMTYEVTVTCFDETADSATIGDTTGEASFNVTFVDAADTCTTDTSITTTATTTNITTITTAISTASNQGVTQQLESDGFFQTPLNAALIALIGGVILGIPLGVVIYMAAKRYMCKSAGVDGSAK